jgi:hypothetical protein
MGGTTMRPSDEASIRSLETASTRFVESACIVPPVWTMRSVGSCGGVAWRSHACAGRDGFEAWLHPGDHLLMVTERWSRRDGHDVNRL